MSLTRASTVRPAQPEGDVERVEVDWKALGNEEAAVVISVLKELPDKDWGNGPVSGFLTRMIVLTGKHRGLVADDFPIYKAGVYSPLSRAGGVGTTMVGRLRPYGTRKNIGLENEEDGDVEIAERALAKFGDPFEEDSADSNGNGDHPRDDLSPGPLATEAASARKAAKERAAMKKAAEDAADEPPF